MSISKFFSFKKSKEENYGIPPQNQQDNIPPSFFTLRAVMEDGEQITLGQCSTHEFLLDSLLDNNIDVAYGCANGVCGKCRAKLIFGQVIEEERIGLTKEEIASQYILVCKSKPQSDVVIDYR